MKNNRKKILIYPKIQLVLVGLNMGLLALITFVIWFQVSKSFETLKEMGVEAKLPETHPYYKFLDLQFQTLSFNLGLAFIIGFILFSFFGLILSHRIAGPIVRLKSFLNSILEKEDVDPNLEFRKKDFFYELGPLVTRVVKKISKNTTPLLVFLFFAACNPQASKNTSELLRSPELASGLQTVVSNQSMVMLADGTPNGAQCVSSEDCRSNYCYPGPGTSKLCIAAESNCAKPSTDGIKWNESYIDSNRAYLCAYGVGLTDLGPATVVSASANVSLDTSNIQNAINSSSDGGVVALNPGDYKINCLSIKNKKNFKLIGLRSNSNRANLQITGDASNMDLRDQWVYDPNRISHLSNIHSDGKINWVADIQEIDQLLNSDENKVLKRDLYKSECGLDVSPSTLLQAGIRIEGSIDGLDIRGLKITGDGKARPRGHAGIYNNSGVSLNRIRIVDNVIEKLVNAIALGGADPHFPVTDILIEENTVQDIVGILAGTGYGIQVEQFPSYEGNIRILNNNVLRAQRHSIYTGRSRKIRVEGNTIIDHRKNAPSPESATWLSAISISRSIDVSVINNQVIGFKDGALELSGLERSLETSYRVKVEGGLIGQYKVIGNKFQGQFLENLNSPPPPAVLIGTSDTAKEFPPSNILVSSNIFDFDVYTGMIQIQNVLNLDMENNQFNIREGSTNFSSTISAIRIYGVGDRKGTSQFSQNLVFKNNRSQFYPTANSLISKVNLFYCPESNSNQTRACQDSLISMNFDSNTISSISNGARLKTLAVDNPQQFTNFNVSIVNQLNYDKVNIPNGLNCLNGSQCSSGYCHPGPENRFYCLAAEANCVEPGGNGIFWNQGYSYKNIQYSCIIGQGLVIQ